MYVLIFEVLERYLNEQGVLVHKVKPTYTSQRYSACGWISKRNRKGKLFKCDKCFFECNADLNASLNISFDLAKVTMQKQLQHLNRSGFYLNAVNEELIVSYVLKV